jgi:hypothetical protein
MKVPPERIIVLSPDDQRRLCEALFSPPAPTAALEWAARSYAELVKQEQHNVEGPDAGSMEE